jgi:PPP family 3-phenylpropionic acid transporter
VGSLVAVILAFLLFVSIQNATWVVVFAVLLNSSLSGQVPLSDAYALQYCQHDLGRYGRLRLWGSLGFVLAVVGFGQWASLYDVKAFSVAAMACLILTFFAALLMKEHPKPFLNTQTSATQAEFLSVALSSNMRWFWAQAFCMIAAHGGLYGFYSLYLQHHGYGADVIGAMWAIGIVAEVAFFWYQGCFFNRMSLSVWIGMSVVACIVRFCLIASFPNHLWILAGAQLLHAFTFAAHHSATMAWLKIQCGSALLARGQAMYIGVAYGLGGFIGTALAGGLWAKVGPSSAFWMSAAFGALGLVCALKLSDISRNETLFSKK